jgi:hypothetical protein
VAEHTVIGRMDPEDVQKRHHFLSEFDLLLKANGYTVDLDTINLLADFAVKNPEPEWITRDKDCGPWSMKFEDCGPDDPGAIQCVWNGGAAPSWVRRVE